MRRFGPNRNRWFYRLWWTQDAAPPHRRRIVTERLRELFVERIVALNHPVEWPPRSPDLTLLDFFLWGYLKAKVYLAPPVKLERMQNEVDRLREDRQMARRAVFSMHRRAEICLQRTGGHAENWKKNYHCLLNKSILLCLNLCPCSLLHEISHVMMHYKTGQNE